MKIKKITIILLALVMTLLSGCSSSVQSKDSKYILMVKNGHPNNYHNSTYDEAFKKFFGSPTWKYFKSNEGKDVVEFTGDCTYENVKVKARQQFILNVNGGTFEAGALSFNDVPQNNLIKAALLSKAFEGDSTKAQDTASTQKNEKVSDNTATAEKNSKVADNKESTKQNSTENKKSANKDEVKEYVIHNIFNGDLSQISNLSIGNPITVNNTAYYGIIYAKNNASQSVKLLCLDYTNKKTLSYDEMDAILAPLGKSHSDLQN